MIRTWQKRSRNRVRLSIDDDYTDTKWDRMPSFIHESVCSYVLRVFGNPYSPLQRALPTRTYIITCFRYQINSRRYHFLCTNSSIWSVSFLGHIFHKSLWPLPLICLDCGDLIADGQCEISGEEIMYIVGDWIVYSPARTDVLKILDDDRFC